ncbi:MAG: hypothetical protein Q4D13_08100 [Erysipelotrichaceae bacterium]|nr:hypothetical protein [Erysipelotrichaceae bacterium]
MSCEIYEIKHSEKMSPEQFRHLIDKKKCEDTEHAYGDIKRKAVIYRGESHISEKMEYINVEEYLKSL